MALVRPHRWNDSVRNTIRFRNFSLAVLAGVSSALAGATAHSDDTGPGPGETYEWSARLVSFDEATNTAVMQARVESYAKIDRLDEFTDGDRLILTWTGLNWAAGIRNLAEDPELTPKTLSLPVEFISAENDGRYVNFRIPVPPDAVTTIAGFEPGTRVTGVSPKMATERETAILTLRHYNDVE
jgi:hypothetical protein